MQRFELFVPPLTDEERSHVQFCLEAGMSVENIVAILTKRRENLAHDFGELLEEQS